MANAKTPKQENVLIKKKKGFTQVQNWAPDDMTLSDKALGLYTRIQRWITFEAEDFECTKAFMRTKTPSGTKAFDASWNELKEKGYLKMYCQMTPRAVWSAELLDEPQPDTPHTYYLNAAGEVTSTNKDLAKKREEKEITLETSNYDGENSVPPKKGYTENNEEFRTPQNGSNGNGSAGNGSTGNGGNNINTSFKNSFNTFSNTNQSINHSEEPEEPAKPPKKKADRLIDGNLIEQVKEQIDYDLMTQSYNLFKGENVEPEDLDAAVEIIAELKATNKPEMFGGVTYDPEFIRKRGASITSDHVRYVFDCFKEQSGEIRNIRKYLKTSFFNAPVTYNASINNELSVEGVRFV